MLERKKNVWLRLVIYSHTEMNKSTIYTTCTSKTFIEVKRYLEEKKIKAQALFSFQ